MTRKYLVSQRLVSGTVARQRFFYRLLAFEIPPALGSKNVPSLASQAYDISASVIDLRRLWLRWTVVMFGYFIEVSVIGIGMVFNMKFYCIGFFIFKKFEYYNALQNNSGLVDYQVRS